MGCAKLFQLAAEKGMQLPNSTWDSCFVDDQGVNKDEKHGAQLLYQAADNKHKEAQFMKLGVMYCKGEGSVVEADAKKKVLGS